MLLSFFDDENIQNLYPLTLTRPAADLRCGLLTIAEKWMHELKGIQYGFTTRDYLQAKFPDLTQADIHINGTLLPTADLVAAVRKLKPGEQLTTGDEILARRSGPESGKTAFSGDCQRIQRPYDIFMQLGKEIRADVERITSGKTPETPSNTNTILGTHEVFIESGATVECAILNATHGPIYIGKHCEIMEGSVVRGPFGMAEGSVLKMGAKVYGPTALGPYSVVGGEVNNIQIQGYSNKGHDGFLGNAVLGEWCNVGADSNCSNLKNNYEEVKVWNYASGRFDKSGQQFCGIIMGDHSKCGINTMFNTGTVVGVAANVFGSGFPRQFIPDFAWGGASGFTTYKLDAACKTASLVMPRRKKQFTQHDENILTAVFEMTREWRNWE
jgi:UDP-N-acetylglucosamine diphosphorylase/glucosamine-1-phosphate N-acetyltransferase